METTESNKLIAEFMEVDIHEYVMNGGRSFEYHTSWDWLIPVVERIHSLGWAVQIYMLPTFGTQVSFYSAGALLELPSRRPNKNNFEATYNAVVEFIQWYNEQKS